MTDLARLPRRVALVLLLADIVGLVAFLNLAHWVRLGSWPGLGAEMTVPVLITLLSLYVLDCYAVEMQVSGMRAPSRTLLAVGVAGLLNGAVVYLAGWWSTVTLFGRGVFPVAMLVFAAWAAAWRFYAALYQTRRASRARFLVLGTGEQAGSLLEDFRNARVEGELAFLEQPGCARDPRIPEAIGKLDDLQAVAAQPWSGIVVALSSPAHQELVERLLRVRFAGTRVYDLADFYEQHWFKVPVLHTHEGWLLFAHGFELLHNPLGLRLKRMLDVVFALLLLLLGLPVAALVALAIKLESQGPVIFKQERMGLDGRVFRIYKFRSMRADAEQAGPQWAADRDPRVTRVGRLLRAWRLDELPQLVNVLRGQMSFIGPRPERPVFNDVLEHQIPYYDLRHLVRPGITGWAQVMYPYGASIEDAREKLQYDLYYIKNYSLMMDMAILLKTLRVVLLGRGR